MNEVNFVITWNKEIPRLMTQMLVICCLWVIGVYFLGHLPDLMLSIHQNTWRGMNNAESSCLRQSSSWRSSVAGLGVSHTLWAASMDTLGYPLPGSVWELWIRHQCPSAKGSSSHQPLCRHFISAVALTCWRTCISALSYLSPLSGRAFPVHSSSALLVGHGCQV